MKMSIIQRSIYIISNNYLACKDISQLSSADEERLLGSLVSTCWELSFQRFDQML